MFLPGGRVLSLYNFAATGVKHLQSELHVFGEAFLFFTIAGG
jgi:hypothetical protein